MSSSFLVVSSKKKKPPVFLEQLKTTNLSLRNLRFEFIKQSEKPGLQNQLV